MGRKRKPFKPSNDDAPGTVKKVRENADSLFLDELHKDAASLLSDLLIETKLVFVEVSLGCNLQVILDKYGFRAPWDAGKLHWLKELLKN